MFFRRKKEKQDQYKKDLEHLKQMQAEGQISASADLDILAKNLAKWRGSDYWADKQGLANFGTDEDLDVLVKDTDVGCRACVAERGRDKDLDKLVSDPDWYVRVQVAYQGRDKDLDLLADDENVHVRNAVEDVRSQKKENDSE